jgi:hypothetical protein
MFKTETAHQFKKLIKASFFHITKRNVCGIFIEVNNFINIKISTDTNSIFQDSRCIAAELIAPSKFNNGRKPLITESLNRLLKN